MTTTTKFATATALALGTLIGVHGSAMATTTEHASICQPYFSEPATGLARGVGNLLNTSGASKNVICPIVRSKDPGIAGMWVFVTGVVPGNHTVTCSTWSFTKAGVSLGSKSASFNGPGKFELAMSMTNMVPSLSSQSVVCTLPPSTQLFSVVPIL